MLNGGQGQTIRVRVSLGSQSVTASAASSRAAQFKATRAAERTGAATAAELHSQGQQGRMVQQAQRPSGSRGRQRPDVAQMRSAIRANVRTGASLRAGLLSCCVSVSNAQLKQNNIKQMLVSTLAVIAVPKGEA